MGKGLRAKRGGLTVVENEVDASQLLQSLEGHAGELALDHVPTEAVDIARLAEAHLVLVVCPNLSQLGSDGRVIRRETSKVSEGLGGLLPLALLDKVPRRLGEDEHSANKNDRPRKLYRDGDTI